MPGTYLAWMDALHDGPVPQTETLSQLSDIRARALAGFGSGDYEKVRSGFAMRDHTLEDFRKHEDVVLWFEHDLYDQLQLLQLLAWLARQDLAGINLDIIQIDSYPGVRPFHGLGQLSGAQLTRLFPMRQRVSPEQKAIATEVWKAFCNSDPTTLLQFAKRTYAGMPFLCAAMQRFFEEYPWSTDGLSRIERQVLQAAAAGKRKRQEIYMESRKQEDIPWGDLSVYLRLSWLTKGQNPAVIEAQTNEFTVTAAGQELLEEKADWIKLQGNIDRWLGGVHLTGQETQWRWNPMQKTLVAA